MDSQPTPPPIPPPNFLDMNELISHLFKRIEMLENDVRQCNEKHLEATQFQNGALVRTIQENTHAIELNTSTIQRIENLLNTRNA